MRRPRLLFLLAPALWLLLPPAFPAAQPKPGAKKPAARQRAAPAAGQRKSAGARRASGARAAAARPRSQQQPDPGRIREIQQALAERGYAVEPTGVWDAATVAALAKFQEDHQINNLSGRGKLDPLTLIALGLGPSYSRPALSGAAGGQTNTEGNPP